MPRDEQPSFDAEARLLLACIGRCADRGNAITEILREPISWPLVVERATRHRVRPTVVAALRELNNAAIPRAVLDELSKFAQANAQRNLWLISQLLRLLDALHSQGIPVIPFKGPILGMTAYGSPAMREAGDLDLLVHRRDIVRAHDVLISLGHEPAFPTATDSESAYLRSLAGSQREAYLHSHSEHHLVREDGLNIDLHWALTVADFHLRLDEAELWKWLTPQNFFRRTIQSFAPEELLLVLCINGAKDCWERLDRIADVAALLRRYPALDLQRIDAAARKIGAARMLHLGVALAEKLNCCAMLADAAESKEVVRSADPTKTRDLHPDRTSIASLTNKIFASLFGPARSSAETASLRRSLMHLRMRERLRDRAGYIIDHLRPGVGDWAALPLPPVLSPLHYLTRPPRLLARYLLCER